MKRAHRNPLVRLLACMVVASGGAGAVQAGDGCTEQAVCTEARSFTATVTNFRTSKEAGGRLVTLTVRFHNKTDKPLSLGYVTDSGIVMDDQGNRYGVWGAATVRGLGQVGATTFDPKFTLAPRESGDARFELYWKNAGSAIAGTTFEFDLAIREITAVTADQYKLGQEHSLHFAQLNETSVTAANSWKAGKTTAPAASVSTAAAPSPVAAPADPCAGANTCYNAGPFIAEVQQVTPSQFTRAGRHHTVKLNVRFRNISNAPIVLAYKSGTSGLMDNHGNRYFWGRAGTHDGSVQGIGYITGRTADAQFTLGPGQARSATFNVVRYNVNSAIGSSFQYDVVINELEVLPGRQVRSLRENSLSFTNLAAGSFDVAQLSGQLPAGVAEAVPPESSDVATKVIDLFNTIRKKDQSR